VLRLALLALAIHLCGLSVAAPITRIWLTHETSAMDTLTINWESVTPGPSRVEYGASESLGNSAKSAEPVTLHHVQVPMSRTGQLHYRLHTGDDQSAIHAVKSYGDAALRVAATANWQLRPRLDAIEADDPHLLLSCGDLVIDVVDVEHPGGVGNTKAFSALIDGYPKLFARVPFLPAPGNHERQIRYSPNGAPTEALYDVEATAFRSFFPLPGDGRIYHVDLPGFETRLVALDLNHVRDMGTLAQSCMPFKRGSEQFDWYREMVKSRPERFMITFFNESGPNVRAQEKGMWENMLRQGSVVLSGFGSFAERAEVKGMPYFTSALKVLDQFGDKANAQFYRAVESYTLITIPRTGELLTVELKGLDGTVLDRSEWPGKPPTGARRQGAP